MQPRLVLDTGTFLLRVDFTFHKMRSFWGHLASANLVDAVRVLPQQEAATLDVGS